MIMKDRNLILILIVIVMAQTFTTHLSRHSHPTSFDPLPKACMHRMRRVSESAVVLVAPDDQPRDRVTLEQ